MYGSGGASQSAGAGSMGTAAAMQALKMFAGGQGGGSSGGYGGQSGGYGGSSGGEGGMMGQAMGMAQKFMGGGGRQEEQQQQSSGGVGGMISSMMGGGSSNQQSHSSGGNAQNQFVGMAMGEASKLFDQQHSNGNVSQGTNKQDVVNMAAKQALKFYMKSEMGGGGGGGLMSMASKFM